MPPQRLQGTPYHLLINPESGTIEVLTKPQADHGHRHRHGHGEGHGHCLPVEPLVERSVKAVLCQGMGRGAYRRMQRHGIGVWLAEAHPAGEALEAWRDGTLAPLSEEQLP